MERLAISARLKQGSFGRAAELIAQGPPFDPASIGFERHAVYVASDEVIFVFEGERADRMVDAIVNDPVVSASFGVWGPLLEGTPTLARPAYYWEKSGDEESLRFEEGWRGD